ncbi:speckle-type POZ protein-like [Musca vetustissima]|uniref:speckle-type POZ protein-like n=1 Tax=Musca vetustissima TaxID=27455 RepID=UPI002AB63D43|nr:speckle-type POZ protein-like [Musca vetustissima]
MASEPSCSNNCILHNGSLSIKDSIDATWFCDRVKVTKFIYDWKVEHFNTFNGDLISPIFTNDHANPHNIKWQMGLTKVKKIVVLKVKLVCSDKPLMHFKFEGYMENGEQRKDISRDNLYKAVPEDVFIFPRPIEIEIEKIPANDTLITHCELGVIDDLIDIPSSDECLDCYEDTDLFQDMGKLLQSEKFSDVTLMVEKQQLKAHKNILSMRSEVFAAMFDNEAMTENTSNCVDINDMEYPVVREMLTFIYTNQAPNIDEMPIELFVAADKYALKKLKAKCEIALNRQLTCNNALEILILADRHNSEVVKLRSIHFIKQNMAEIEKNDDWQTMLTEYPQLIEEIEFYNGCVEM